jgi:hypothetical protein
VADQVYDLEFNGPFPDWWNVVDDFGADPTGVVDSTEAFQNMFNAMCVYGGTVKNGLYMGYTGYIPNGTYRISGTLLLPSPYTGQPVSGEGVNLWGQDPANVILKWAGESGQTMFASDGCHSSTIGRITLDGQGVAGVGFQLERNPNIPLQNTYSRLQDCVIKDVTKGFWQSANSQDVGLDSEFSIMRCEFYRCSEYGIQVTKGEAYNFWIRQSHFEDCGIAIANGPYGGFSVYDSTFVRSATYDIHAEWMRICGIRRNRSFDSNRFIYVKGANIVIEGNEVSNTTETDAVVLDNRFKVMVLNNKFKSAPEATTGPVVNEIFNPFSPFGTALAPFAPLFIFFNQFTVPNPINLLPNTTMGNEMEDNITNPDLVVEMPPLVPHPPQVIRQTFYLDALNDPQQTIDDATAYALANPESNPVIYLPCYSNQDRVRLSKTLIFPANIKMSFQGGGTRSGFFWNNATRDSYQDPYVLFRGPSKITIQNIQIGFTYAEGGKAGLIAVFDNCDQVGSRVYADNCNGIYQFRALANLEADLCDYVVGSYNDENLPVLISSPPEAEGSGRVLHEGGAGSDGDGNEPIVSVQTGGRYYLREFWYETNNTDKVWATLVGMGGRPSKFVIEASLIEQHTSEQKWRMKVIEASNWWGNILYVDSLIIGTTKFAGEATRANYLSFGGGSPPRSDSMTPATMYRHDGIPYYISGFWTMDLTQETMTDNSGWGVYGTKSSDWQESLWDTVKRVPVTWIDILGDGLTDVRLHRVRADIAFMSDAYTLIEDDDLVEITDFMSAVLPDDTTFDRASGATMFNATPVEIWGPENLILYSQDLGNAAWTPSASGTGSNPVVTSNDATAPDGTMTATKLVFDVGAGTANTDWSVVTSSGIPEITNGVAFGYSFWLKGSNGTQLLVRDIGGDAYPLYTCNGEWQRVRRWGIGSYGLNDTMEIGIRQAVSGTINSSATVWIWGVQVERYTGPSRAYIPTAADPVFGPRFDHDPSSGQLQGLLIEPASANACANSRALAGTGWTSVNLTTSDNSETSPDGTNNAARLTEDNTTNVHECEYNTVNIVNGSTYGLSCFVKNVSGSRWLQLSLGGGQYFNFNPSTGEVGSGSGVSSITVRQVANGWWRIGAHYPASATVGTSIRLYMADSGTATGAPSYAGDGSSAIVVWGVQLDNADVGVTSYIPTRGATLTRSADELELLRANGTYDVEITRQDGVEVLADQVISAGTFAVPASASPIIKIVTTRKST